MKKLIIFVIIIIIILISALLVIKYLPTNQQNEIVNNDSDDDVTSGDLYDYDNAKTETLTDEASFYTVSNCVSKYLDMLNKESLNYYEPNENREYVKVVDDNAIAQKIIDILDKNYITKNNITTKNLFSFVEEVTTNEIFIPLKMNILPGRTTEKYAVYGYTQSIENKFIRNIYIIVTLDVKNNTFSIEPLLKSSYKDIDEIKLSNENVEIEKNNNNTYTYEKINRLNVINKYLDSFKNMMLSNSSLAYEYLEENYKNAKFGNYNNFKQWIADNKEKLNSTALSGYSTTIKDDYTQYVCTDRYGRYFIFQEVAPMQYKVILDTYTIDLPEFVEKYNNSKEEEKVLLNIQKFLEAINNADYEYAYNKLDETYKANNFKTLEDFEKYIKENFYEQNKATAKNAEKQDDIYLYTVTISDASEKSEETITKTFVMQLKEGTDFVMSFSVN